MLCKKIIQYIEDWAPVGIAWDKDNVGLQVGDPDLEISNILLALELTDGVLNDAISKNCNLIITHHPFIFNPIKNLNFYNDPSAKLINKLIKNNITLYSAHTNLDFTKNGVSFHLAKVLGLNEISFLHNLKENQVKLAVFLPADNVEEVANAMFEAGGGIIGEYQNCSFRTNGRGTFKGSEETNPSIGKKNIYEKVDEIRFELLVNKWSLNKVLTAMIEAHPYEEPAYDIYTLQNKNVNYGIGAIGKLSESLKTDDFLLTVAKKLKGKNLRYTAGKSKIIQKVAVCGGSGSDLLAEAVKAGADAFITADVKYHTFHDAQNKILLVDAGHYETEIHILDEVKERIKKLITNKSIKIYKYRGSTNPVHYLTNYNEGAK
jgi:dinuclear metal center YbgI/SA1388 family protein